MPSSIHSNNRRRRRPRRSCFSMAQTCIHGVPEQELTSKKLAAPSHSCPTGKAASLLFFLLSSCCFGRVAAVNFSALTQEGGQQQMDDDQHQSDWPHKNRLYNLHLGLVELRLKRVGFPQTDTTLQNVTCFPVGIFHRPKTKFELKFSVQN